MHEFDIINTYFMCSPANGDDAALIEVTPQHSLVSSVDTSVAGRHFATNANPFDVGYKSLAVSISDIAAMGAKPTAFLLSLSLPTADKAWLSAFSEGLYTVANSFHLEHIGGDLTKGPLVISSVVFGEVPLGRALKRHGACCDDDVYVSGILGEAGRALHDLNYDATRLNRPEPRVALGIALRDIAHSCIDVSDGFTQDLQHILDASGVGATLFAQHIPHCGSLDRALTAGDDYELCFTAPLSARLRIQTLSKQLGLALTRVGVITRERGLVVMDQHGQPLAIKLEGFQHF